MSINISDLFTKLGKIFRDQEVVNTFRSDTSSIANVVTEFDGESLSIRRALNSFQNADINRQSALSASIQSARSVAQELIIETVAADVSIPRKALDLSLAELIRQMITAGSSVDESSSTISVGSITGSSNVAVVGYMRDVRGDLLQYHVPEGIRVECTSDTSLAATSFLLTGEIAIADQLSQDWPGGSGVSKTITAATPTTSILSNSGFDDEDDLANVPDDWYLSVGTPGTTIKMTDYEVQRIAVAGPPTAGTYRISWVNSSSQTQVTEALAYDADGDTVQDALNALAGLETVEVSTTGTSPLYTHDITFTGIAGNPAQFTIINNTTGGTYTPSTVTSGSANAFSGKAVEFDSNGAELTTICQRIELSPLTRYAFSMRIKADVVPASGNMAVYIADGVEGTIIQDEAGTTIETSINCAGLTTSFAARSFAFTTPQSLPPQIYLMISIDVPVSTGTSIFFDHACLTPMTELYAGGPCVAIFGGSILPMAKNGTSDGDYLTLTIANNLAGKFQEYFERNFQMAAKRLRLPSNNAGGETIADTLIS